MQAYYTELQKHTSDNEASRAVLVLDSLDSDIHLLSAGEDVGLREGAQAKLLQSIVGVGNDFTEEDIPVRLSILFPLVND